MASNVWHQAQNFQAETYSRALISQVLSPTLPEPPNMEVQRFFVTHIDKSPLYNSYCVTATTDTPCHLWLRYTKSMPVKHPRGEKIRGLILQEEVYYCFTAYKDLEQLEVGDTLFHTFPIPDILGILGYTPHFTELKDSQWKPFLEPWKEGLTTYNSWKPFYDTVPPSVTVAAGMVQLENMGDRHCGIICPVPAYQIPLLNDANRGLTCQIYSNYFKCLHPRSSVLWEYTFTDQGFPWTLVLYYCAGPDSVFQGDKGTYFSVHAMQAWQRIYQYRQTVNLLDLYQWACRQHDLPENPRDIDSDYIMYTLADPDQNAGDLLWSNWVSLFFPPSPEADLLYFYLHGTINGRPSPSTTQIFNLPYPRQEVMKNLSFEDWPDPDLNADFWNRFTFGTGWSKWHREEDDIMQGKYCIRLEAGGYARGTGYRQAQDPYRYRGQTLKFKAWGKGKAYANNDLDISVNGTGGWRRHAQLTENNTWQEVEITGKIPLDATTLTIRVRCYSPGYGPIYGWWDYIRIEVAY